jgi:hypothetical protein
VKLPKLSQESLEKIAVAIIQAKDENGLVLRLNLEDVLTPKALEQFPRSLYFFAHGGVGQLPRKHAHEQAKHDIESFFTWVHPNVGTWARCSTGEAYETIAIAASSPQIALRMLVDAFRVMSQHTALIKPEGAPVCIADERPRYLYWRRLPEVVPYEAMPESSADPVPPPSGLWQATARAVISLRRDEGSQEPPA